jgi:hypothetical protein
MKFTEHVNLGGYTSYLYPGSDRLGRPSILSDDFCGFAQTLQENAGTVP